ncbi:MAG: 2-C-methyl-D-erythritol 2,4-cyclodiphosphate synthase [Gammaproteobacteria bacterium]|nr:2-C-methyl-D-erythritol 2,4-cyclodiphosphate synthase [Gammaproteobacteria bacterium]
MRIGQGYDVHAFAENRKLILGGVEIPFEKGLAGHSDADVLIHAICDALLGAAAMGDIGQHFPDTDEDFKNIDSRILLRHVSGLISKAGYNIGNIDATIVAQRPKLLPHIDIMREKLSADLEIALSQLNIKATTTEKLGFEGRGEGIAAHAIVLLE